MNRREFLSKGAQLALSLPLASYSSPAQYASTLTRDFHQWEVIDALCGLNAETLPITQQSLQQALDSGISAVNWTVSAANFDDTLENIAFVESLIERDPVHWTMIRRSGDLDQAKRDKKIGVIFGFQNPEPLSGSIDRFELFRRLGVRVMQLTYNNRSLFGDGCLEPGNAGLSKLGRTAVSRMNELGIAVDLSHSGQRTTAEGIAASAKPVLITHSGCNAIHSHPRNKDDRELKALADRGGVIGIYFMPYLVASPTLPTREHVLDHLDHAIEVCGADHVGIGSDGVLDTFPDTPEQRKSFADDMANRKRLGIAAPEEDRPPYSPDLNTPHRMEIIAAGLSKRGHSSEVIEKVMGGNFRRAFLEIWAGT